jgi:hypothetical protein
MIALKRLLVSAAVVAAVAVPVFTSTPAQAWWRGGWGWHAGWGWRPGWGLGPGWGWRGGVYVGLPPVVVGGPAYPPYPYAGYSYPYPAYAYAGWRWVPGFWGPGGVWVAGRWVR